MGRGYRPTNINYGIALDFSFLSHRRQFVRSIRTRRRLPLILHVPAPSLLRGPVVGAGGCCSRKSGGGGKGGRNGGKGWLLETATARKSNHGGFAPCKAYLIKLINNSPHRLCVCVRLSDCLRPCACVHLLLYVCDCVQPASVTDLMRSMESELF